MMSLLDQQHQHQHLKLVKKCDDPLTMYANDILTIPVNLAGVPAISVPCGFANGLPLGLQIIGKHFDESTIYRVAHAFEQATDYHKAKTRTVRGEKSMNFETIIGLRSPR